MKLHRRNSSSDYRESEMEAEDISFTSGHEELPYLESRSLEYEDNALLPAEEEWDTPNLGEYEEIGGRGEELWSKMFPEDKECDDEAEGNVSESKQKIADEKKRTQSDRRSEPRQAPSSEFIGDLALTRSEIHFVSGSKYEGSWDAVGMAGVGRYTTACNVLHEGEFRDGLFHGHGSTSWPRGQRVDGVWLRGELRAKRYTFGDGLVFREHGWQYCEFPDRRFYECIRDGLKPAGRTLKTNCQPSKFVPQGCYDTGDGIFDPKINSILSYDSAKKVIRIPSVEEGKWIRENCRKGTLEPTGHKPSLQENWSENPPELPYVLPLSHDSPDTWWQRLTTFERDGSVKIEEGKPIDVEERSSIGERSIICDDFSEHDGEPEWDYSGTSCMARRYSTDVPTKGSAAEEIADSSAAEGIEQYEESTEGSEYEEEAEEMRADALKFDNRAEVHENKIMGYREDEAEIRSHVNHEDEQIAADDEFH